MTPTQSLVGLFLITSFTAIILLIIAYAFDFDNFKNEATGRLAVLPSLPKIARLFGSTKKPVFQIIYLFAIIMTLFSYIAFLLLVAYTVGWLTNMF